MSPALELRGTYIPLITPLDQDGRLDLSALEQLAYRYLDAGLSGLVALGTTGEPVTLSLPERSQVIDLCSKVCSDRRAHLIIGTGSNNTAATIEDLQRMADVEAVSAALCLVPYYLRPGQAGIMAHFEAIAEASPVPIMVYNIPERTAQTMDPDTLLELAHHPNIVGVKQSVPLDVPAMRVIAESPRDFAVLCGEDPYLFPSALLGASGAITAAAHLCPERIVAMIQAGLEGRVDEGRMHHEVLLPLIGACFAEPSPTIFKGVLHRQGHISSPSVRLPLVPASSLAIDRAMAALSAAGT